MDQAQKLCGRQSKAYPGSPMPCDHRRLCWHGYKLHLIFFSFYCLYLYSLSDSQQFFNPKAACSTDKIRALAEFIYYLLLLNIDFFGPVKGSIFIMLRNQIIN
ncbi:hypothetical protein CLU79DRAFT_411351 [Phycomyces nitens]|nr:hypothetical protein CLU79DRAFT_411351 [Phycomyces nitens]